jgi:hypothetical protein
MKFHLHLAGVTDSYRGCAVRPPPDEEPPLELPPSDEEPPLELPPLELSPFEPPPLEYPPLDTDPPDDFVPDRVEPVDEPPLPDEDVPCPCAVSPASRDRTRV